MGNHHGSDDTRRLRQRWDSLSPLVRRIGGGALVLIVGLFTLTSIQSGTSSDLPSDAGPVEAQVGELTRTNQILMDDLTAAREQLASAEQRKREGRK